MRTRLTNSPVGLGEQDAPQSGRVSPENLNEQDEETAAAQEGALRAQAAALRALLDEEPNLGPQNDEDELPALVQS
jgi:hypothetical protein